MEIKILLIVIGLIATIIYMFSIIFGSERMNLLKTTSIDDILERYLTKIPSNKRIVALIECENGLCNETIKSLLDQSVRLNDIAIETNFPEQISKDLRRVVSVHKPNTLPLRETESDTIIFKLRNGEIYNYDFIENAIHDMK